MKLLHLFNSLTNRMEIFKPVHSTDVKISVCRTTVSQPVNLQDARIYISLDIIRRILEEYFSYNLRFVMNIIDIDDKVVERKYENEFSKLMDKLNVRRPDFSPKATDHINEIIKFIYDLAYFTFVSDGNVYFNLNKYKTRHSYNILRPQDSKLSNFVLWQKNMEGYLSEYGIGVPAPYVQCSAVSLAFLGSTIDIKAGGIGLCFPHHENEIALNRAWSGNKKFVNYLLHIGSLEIEQNSMTTLSEILENISPKALRLLFIQHHNWSCLMRFNMKELEKAQLIIDSLFGMLSKIETHLLTAENENTRVSRNEMNMFCEMKLKINEAFCESINTSKAFEILMGYIHYMNINLEKLSLPILRISDAYVKFILGLFGLI